MENITDTRVSLLNNIINDYISSITCIKETFNDSWDFTLNKTNQTTESYNKFLTKNSIKTVADLIAVPSNIKTYKQLWKKKSRAKQSFEIIPQSLFVSMISKYDVLIGKLLTFIYKVDNQKLYDIDKSIPARELFKAKDFNDIEFIRNQIISEKVENLLRDSHKAQLITLSKLLKNTPLNKVTFWSDFIEMTQRRNLFVHCNGIVSEQYIKECEEEKCSTISNLGDVLAVDQAYFLKAYFVFYCMGVMLSQVISRKLLGDSLAGELDSVLNNIIYEPIVDEDYDIAIELSKFAVSKNMTSHRSRLDSMYFILNHAQAYKWSGNQEKCLQTLKDFDFTAVKDDILIAKYALEDNEEKVIELMKSIGRKSDIMNEEAYATWEIYKKIRDLESFKNCFESVFGKTLEKVEKEIDLPIDSKEESKEI